MATLAFGLAGCSADGGGTDASEEPTETSDGADETTTTAAPTPEEAATAAYQASWDVTFRSLNPAQEDPEWSRR